MASHLTLEEREIIAHMHRVGKMQTQIADRLGRSKSTISRELRRNRSRNGYWGVAAQRKAEKRRSQRPWVCKLERSEVRRYVRERLRQRWTPDEIAGRSRSDFPHDRRKQISHQTIYTWIRSQAAAGKHWQRYLRRLGRKRPAWENRGRMRACVSIEGRPAVARATRNRNVRGVPRSVHAHGPTVLPLLRPLRATGGRPRPPRLLSQSRTRSPSCTQTRHARLERHSLRLVAAVIARHATTHEFPDPRGLSSWLGSTIKRADRRAR